MTDQSQYIEAMERMDAGRPFQPAPLRNLDDQVAIYDALAPKAVQHLRTMLDERVEEIVTLGRYRLIAGYKNFGNTTWQYEELQLLAEILEELADGTVYETMRMRGEK